MRSESCSASSVCPPSLSHPLVLFFPHFLRILATERSIDVETDVDEGVMLTAMGLYLTVWKLGQKRSAREELQRRQELSSRGFGEKAVDRGIDDGKA